MSSPKPFLHPSPVRSRFVVPPPLPLPFALPPSRSPGADDDQYILTRHMGGSQDGDPAAFVVVLELCPDLRVRAWRVDVAANTQALAPDDNAIKCAHLLLPGRCAESSSDSEVEKERARPQLLLGNYNGAVHVCDVSHFLPVDLRLAANTACPKVVVVAAPGDAGPSILDTMAPYPGDPQTPPPGQQPPSTFLSKHAGSVSGVALSANGARAASATAAASAAQLRVTTVHRALELWAVPLADGMRPLSVALDARGAVLAAGFSDGSVSVWHVDRRVHLFSYAPHLRGVMAVALSPDGAIVVSASRDGVVRIAEVQSGAEVCAPLQGHTTAVTNVALSPDGSQVFSVATDGSRNVWDLSDGAVVSRQASPCKSDDSTCQVRGLGTTELPDLVQNIFSVVGIPLAAEDRALFDATFQNLVGVQLDSCEAQMKHLGVSIDDEELTPAEKMDENIVQFTLSYLDCSVTVNKKLLSPAGLSLLMWILIPCSDFLEPICAFMVATTFKNCFIEEILGVVRPGPTKFLVVPENWLRWFGLDQEFTECHQHQWIEGDLGISIGMNGTPEIGRRKAPWRKRIPLLPFLNQRVQKNTELVEEYNETALERDPLSPHSSIPPPSSGAILPEGSESLEGNGEHFLLKKQPDGTCKMFYQPKVINSCRMTSVAGGFKVLGCEATLSITRQPLAESILCHQHIAEGLAVQIDSLREFLRRHLISQTQRSIVRRLHWLGRICKAMGIFPDGENQSFLKAVLCDIASYEPTKIFMNPDCRIPSGLLIDDGVKGRGKLVKNANHKLFFSECKNFGGGVYATKGTFDSGVVKVQSCERVVVQFIGDRKYEFCDLV